MFWNLVLPQISGPIRHSIKNSNFKLHSYTLEVTVRVKTSIINQNEPKKSFHANIGSLFWFRKNRNVKSYIVNYSYYKYQSDVLELLLVLCGRI